MSLLPFDDRDGWIWLDGSFTPWREAKVHVLTHGLHYASSVFEGERMYGGEVFKLTEHSERLRRTASTKRPGEDAGKKDASRASKGGEETKAGKGVPKEEFRGAGLHGNDWSVVDVSPGKMAPADDVVKLVAKVAPADMRFP